MQSVQDLATAVQRVISNVEKVIVGKGETVAFSLIAVVCRGHVLIEDVPGVGKTVLTKAIACSIGCTFKRIQFTPDLLPSDVTGTSIYNQKTGNFEFRPGPIMAQIVLADEMNILDTHQHHHPLDDLVQIMTAEELVHIQQQIRHIYVDPSIREYIVSIANATRNHSNVYLGASPRGSLALFRTSQALAAVRGRGYVIPDDVKLLAKPTLAHRIIVTPAARVRSITSTAVLEEILQSVPVPNAWVGGGKGR